MAAVAVALTVAGDRNTVADTEVIAKSIFCSTF